MRQVRSFGAAGVLARTTRRLFASLWRQQRQVGLMSVPSGFPRLVGTHRERRGAMYDLAFPVDTLKREHEDRLRSIQRRQLARQLAGGAPNTAFLLKTLGDMLVAAGRQLQTYAGETARPLGQADPGVAR